MGYALRVDGSTPIPVIWSGGQASASTPGAGWAAIAARTYGSGYELLWRNTSGAYGSWILNASGGLVSFRTILAADVLQLETQYGVDINSDSRIGASISQ